MRDFFFFMLYMGYTIQSDEMYAWTDDSEA